MRVHWSARLVVGVVGAVVVLAMGGVLLMSLTDKALGLLRESEEDVVAYVVVFIFLLGDSVSALLPGETTLNTASVLASQDELRLPLVIAAGALGATIGDNLLYWIARSVPGLQKRIRMAKEDPRFDQAISLIGRRAELLIMFCRYLPFVRWGVTASMGAIPIPYRTYLPWSVAGDIVWATYTCLVAYYIGTALDEYPLLSIVIASVSSTLLVAIVFVVERTRNRRQAPRGSE